MTETCDTCGGDLNPFDPGVFRLDSVTETWSRKGDHSLMPRIRRLVSRPTPPRTFRHASCMERFTS